MNEEIQKPEATEEPSGVVTPPPPPVTKQEPGVKQERKEPSRAGRAIRGFFGFIFACVLLGAAGWATRDLWMTLFYPPAPLDVPYMITNTTYTGTDLSKDGADFTAAFDIEIFEREGWKKINLLPSDVAITRMNLPGDSYMNLENGCYSMLTKKRGKMKVSVDFSIAASEAEGVYSVMFRRVPSVTCSLDASFPEEDLEIKVPGAQSTEITETNGATRVNAAMPDDTPIKLSWEKALPEIKPGPSRYYSETKTLISVSEGFILGQTKMDFTILHTPTREVQLKVPKGVSVLEISGKDVRDWRVTEGRLSVQLEKEVIGPYVLSLKYESSPNVASGRVQIPVITGHGVEREKGDIGVVALTNVEVKNDHITNAHAIDVKELPAEILGMTSQPVLLAYRYVVPDFNVGLEIQKHADSDILLTILDRAHFTVMQTHDGKRITRAIYNVRNNRNQFLRLELPEGAELWSASVAGRSAQPTEDEQGRVLLPLIRSQGRGGMSAFPVEIVYAEEGTKPDDRGAGVARVGLPASSQPIMHLMVSLYLPTEGKYDRFDGTLRSVKQFTKVGGQAVTVNNMGNLQAIQKMLAQKVVPASGAGPMEVQLPVSGKPYLMEKILVVKDDQWLSYRFRNLKG